MGGSARDKKIFRRRSDFDPPLLNSTGTVPVPLALVLVLPVTLRLGVDNHVKTHFFKKVLYPLTTPLGPCGV